MDRDLFLSSESGETLSYLGTRSRATRSAEEARDRKESRREEKLGRERSRENREGKKGEQGEDSSEEYHGTFAFMCYLLVRGKILSYKSTPAEKLLAREGTMSSGSH